MDVMSTHPEIFPEDPRWKRFEKLVARMYSTLSPNVRVDHYDRIMGRNSGIQRQIDVSLRTSVPGSDLLVIVQCRDYSRALDVNEVGEFASVVADVRASKGVMVAQNGFSTAAMRLATALGIDLLTLVDAENKLWSEYFPEDAGHFKQVVTFPVTITHAILACRLLIPRQVIKPGFQVQGECYPLASIPIPSPHSSARGTGHSLRQHA